MRYYIFTLIIYSMIHSYSFGQKMNAPLLENILKEAPADFQNILENPKHQIQIIYTQIDRDEKNQPHFTTHTFKVNPTEYFYPASTIKMPMAFLALEKLNNLSILGLDKNTPMLTQIGSSPQTSATTDPTSATLLPSIAHYIRKIFLVSDNDANNRLYEFLGQRYLNEQLRNKGFKHTRIIHRLGSEGVPFNTITNRYTNPISFIKNNQLLYHQGEVWSAFDTTLVQPKHQQKGIAYYKAEQKINEPFNFGVKNFVALQDLQNILKTVIFPQAHQPHQRFNLTDSDYSFLYKTMSTLPKASQYPSYPNKPDNYVKFFMYGDKAEDFNIPSSIKIFNKVGWAYGFLTDVAYIVDFDKKVEFFLAATIHVNDNQTYNDNEYQYESIGLPFLAELGRCIYNYEVKRMRKHLPNLERFSDKGN